MEDLVQLGSPPHELDDQMQCSKESRSSWPSQPVRAVDNGALDRAAAGCLRVRVPACGGGCGGAPAPRAHRRHCAPPALGLPCCGCAVVALACRSVPMVVYGFGHCSETATVTQGATLLLYLGACGLVLLAVMVHDRARPCDSHGMKPQEASDLTAGDKPAAHFTAGNKHAAQRSATLCVRSRRSAARAAGRADAQRRCSARPGAAPCSRAWCCAGQGCAEEGRSAGCGRARPPAAGGPACAAQAAA